MDLFVVTFFVCFCVSWFNQVSAGAAVFQDPLLVKKKGAMFDTFLYFKDSDLSKRAQFEDYKHDVKKPYIVQDTDKFEFSIKYWFDHLFRAQAYFVPKKTGKHIFYVTCKARCQFDLSDVGFDIGNKGENVIVSKLVGADIALNNRKSNSGKSEIDLNAKQRYYITVFSLVKKDFEGWIGLGVVHPDNTEEFPLSNSVYTTPVMLKYHHLKRYQIQSAKESVSSMKSRTDFFDNPPTRFQSYRAHEKFVDGSFKTTDSWNKFYSTYINFYYHNQGKLKFRVNNTNIDFSVVINGEAYNNEGRNFTHDFKDQWHRVEIFYSTTTKSKAEEKFELRTLIENEDEDEEEVPLNQGLIYYSREADNFPAPKGATKSPTSVSFTINAHSVSQQSAFGDLQSYRLEVWGPGLPKKTIAVPKNGPLTEQITGLNIYSVYSASVYYVGSELTVKTKETTAMTGQSSPSDPPSSLTVHVQSSTYMKLACGQILQNRNGIIIKYTASYAKVDKDGTTVVGEWKKATSNNNVIHLRGLNYWTYYAIKVAGETYVGPGPYTTQKIERTREHSPTGPPLDVSGHNLTETSIQTSWKEIVEGDRNGVITHYKIKYKNVRTEVSAEKEVGAILTAQITDLKWFEDYEVQVCGKTSGGVGVCSTPIVISTDEWIPQAPPHNVRAGKLTATSIELLFDDIVDTFKIFGHPTGSKIKLTAVSDVFVQDEVRYGGINSVILTGLYAYTNYSLSVAIGTRRGFDVFSAPILVRTHFGPPAAPPKDIVSKKINSTALNIKFGLIVLDDRNGIIDNYEVKICKLNDTNCRTFIVAENDATKSLDVGGLEKWRDYMYSVTGCTLGGCGGTSPMAIQRTDEDLPEKPPANLTAQPASSTSIQVNWDEVPEGFRRGIIRKYHLQYKDDTIEPPEWKSKMISVPTQQIVIDNLKFFTSYSIKIRAQTVKGPAKNFSLEISSKTLEDEPKVFPSNFTCNNESSSTIKCGWEKALEIYDHVNGAILGYRIYYSVADCKKAELANCDVNKTFVDNITAPDLTHTIKNLIYYTEYNIQIELFNGFATGPRSSKIIVYTDEDIPSAPPTNVEGFTMTTTSVAVYWDNIPWGTSHGIIIGYVCYYRRMNTGPAATELLLESKRKRRSLELCEEGELCYNQTQITDVSIKNADEPKSRSRRSSNANEYLYPEEAQYVNYTATGMEIVNLTLFQWYTLRLAAMTSKGPGPTFDLNVSCAQAVPRAGPNITLQDKFSFTQLKLNWSILQYDDAMGTVLKYTVIYYPVKMNGEDLSPFDQEVTSYTFDFPTQSMEVDNLQPFMTYAFRVAAQTFAGPGVFSKPFYAETCRCEKYFYAAYRNHLPFFEIDSNGKEIGLLKDLVKQATLMCCGNCSNGHGTTEVIWKSPLNTVTELNDAIMDNTEFVLPIETDYSNMYYKNKPYVAILGTPGVSIFSRKVEYVNVTNDMMLFAASVLWTFVIIVVLIVIALGMVMWVVQCNPLQFRRTNSEDFPDSFFHGAGAGIWWAFNTVLRVGYGDIVGTGRLGRIITIPITVVGISVGATLVGGLCSMYLAYSVQKTEGSIFSKKVVVLDQSYDQTIIQRIGGRVTETVKNADELVEALRSERVDRLAVDAIYAAYHSKTMSTPDIVYRDIKESGGSQGIVFGGSAARLEKCFRNFFSDKKVELLERQKAIIDADKRNYANNELLDKRSAMLKYESEVWMLTIKVLGGLFCVAFLAGCIYECCKCKKNKVQAEMVCHDRCFSFFEKEARESIGKFEKRFEKKINKMEVKHAFEREYLIRSMRKYVEWLTPDQVNKYKF